MTPATAVPVSEVPNSIAPQPPGPTSTRAQREKPFTTSVVVWGNSNDGGEIPDATKAALEAAPGIARLAATNEAFAAVTTEGRICA